MIPYKKLIIAGITLVAFVAVYYMGYNKRGEVEAIKTTKAYEKAIQEKSKEWQSKLELAVVSAREEAMSRAKGKVVTQKVIEYVETKSTNPVCYDNGGMQLIAESIGNP